MRQLSEELLIALAWHCTAMTIILALIAVILIRCHRFGWLNSGFWVWCAANLFFLLNPLATLISGKDEIYARRIAMTEGSERIYWVCATISVGLLFFYVAYLRVPRRVNLRHFALPMTELVFVTLLAFLTLGIYSVLAYRASLTGELHNWEMNQGHFTGDVTGWEVALHQFLTFPILFFLMFRKTRLLGGLCLISTTAVRIFDPSDRFTVIAPFFAVVLIYLMSVRKTWPPLWSLAGLTVILIFLIGRGHGTIDSLATHTTTGDFFEPVEDIFTGADSDMLPQMYVSSAIFDQYGFNYGIPLLNSTLFGFLPRKIFPWKDQLFDLGFQPTERPILRILVGPKQSVIGCLYTYGGFIAIIIGMWTMGLLARQLDLLVQPHQPISVRTLGAIYMSFVWMLFASDLTWTLQYLALAALPLVASVLLQNLLMPSASSLALRIHVRRSGQQ